MALGSSRSIRRLGRWTRAAQQSGLDTIQADVREGGLREAILHSVGANASHGLRRSNEDKRRAVTILLEDPLVSSDPETSLPWSNREIARRCAVDESLVRKLRPVTAGEPQSDRAYRDRHGNVTQMRTGAIGRKPIEAPTQESSVNASAVEQVEGGTVLFADPP